VEVTALQAFLAVAEHGSFSRAADALFLTQPAVSKRISALEDELRTPLFDRMGRSVRLTEAGETLLPHARRVLGELESGRQAVADLQGRVGCRRSCAATRPPIRTSSWTCTSWTPSRPASRSTAAISSSPS